MRKIRHSGHIISQTENIWLFLKADSYQEVSIDWPLKYQNMIIAGGGQAMLLTQRSWDEVRDRLIWKRRTKTNQDSLCLVVTVYTTAKHPN